MPRQTGYHWVRSALWPTDKPSMLVEIVRWTSPYIGAKFTTDSPRVVMDDNTRSMEWSLWVMINVGDPINALVSGPIFEPVRPEPPKPPPTKKKPSKKG